MFLHLYLQLPNRSTSILYLLVLVDCTERLFWAALGDHYYPAVLLLALRNIYNSVFT